MQYALTDIFFTILCVTSARVIVVLSSLYFFFYILLPTVFPKTIGIKFQFNTKYTKSVLELYSRYSTSSIMQNVFVMF